MTQVNAILVAKIRMARHQIASVRHESKLKIAVITVSAFLLWYGAYRLFRGGFDWLIRFGDGGRGEFRFGDLLMQQGLSILTLSVFALLIFSNVLVAFSTLYRSKEVIFLLQAPITFRDFYFARFYECVVFSSWSLLFLGSPLMLAYGVSSGVSPVFYLANLVFFGPFVVIPACLGALIAMLLVRVFPRLRVWSMAVLGVVAVVLFFAYVRQTLARTDVTDDNFLYLFIDATARTQSKLLPSYWMAEGVLSAARFRLGEMTYYFALLASNALFGLWATSHVAQWIFYPGWSFLMGQDRQRIKPEGRGPLGKFERLLRRLPNPLGALVNKDVKLFWRDPTQWSQFVIFFGIMAIYIANLRNTSRYYEEEFWRSWIACLNVGAVTLILATLTSRFVFPLISLEGRRFWILGLAPLSFKQLLWQKFWLSVATTSGFTVGLAILSGYMLQLEPVYFALTVYSVVVTNLGLAGLAVGLGALYPTFTEDNPARIVSGMGGTLNLLLSVGYIAVVVAAQTFVLQWRVLEMFAPGAFVYALGGAVLIITAVSALCALGPMRLGLRNLNRMEF